MMSMKDWGLVLPFQGTDDRAGCKKSGEQAKYGSVADGGSGGARDGSGICNRNRYSQAKLEVLEKYQ